MGYTTRGSITDYWPDNTNNCLYILADMAIDYEDMMEQIKAHFGENIDFTIRAERIHTSCIYYDLYDHTDYTNFLIIERK